MGRSGAGRCSALLWVAVALLAARGAGRTHQMLAPVPCAASGLHGLILEIGPDAAFEAFTTADNVALTGPLEATISWTIDDAETYTKCVRPFDVDVCWPVSETEERFSLRVLPLCRYSARLRRQVSRDPVDLRHGNLRRCRVHLREPR